MPAVLFYIEQTFSQFQRRFQRFKVELIISYATTKHVVLTLAKSIYFKNFKR